MTPATYSKNSPYHNTPQVNENGIDYLDFWNGIAIQANSSDSVIILDSRYQHRADLLSYDLYGTPQLWWVFMLRNPDVIKDPIWDFVPGVTIYAPAKSSLTGYL